MVVEINVCACEEKDSALICETYAVVLCRLGGQKKQAGMELFSDRQVF